MKSTKSSTANMIVPEGLKGFNYNVWSIFMKTYLIGEGLWEIVEGIEGRPEETSTEYKSWREKNGKALHSIQISCEDEILSFIRQIESAKDAWDRLALVVKGSISPVAEGIGEGNLAAEMARPEANARTHRDLFQAVFWGDWEKTKSILDSSSSSSSLLTTIISPIFGTALHVAVAAGHLKLVEKMVGMINPESLSTTKECPLSPLHYAAHCGHTKIAEVLVEKNSGLLQILNRDGIIPVAEASRVGNKDTTRYLHKVTSKEALIHGDRKSGATLLNSSIAYEMYDIAIDLLGYDPMLAIVDDVYGCTTIRVLASIPDAFPSGGLSSIWQQWIYTCAPIHNERKKPNLNMGNTSKNHITVEASHWLYGVAWSALNLFVPGVKRIHSKKRIHVQTLQVLKCVCSQISSLDKPQLQAVGLFESLFSATILGTVEIVQELLNINPNLLQVYDKENRNILSLAILYRQEKIFKLICGIRGILMPTLAQSMDIYGNTILHLAGKSLPSSREQGNKIMPGAALQMQRELQWFQEVEKIAPLSKEHPNSKGLKPHEVFKEEHKDLISEGETWMKETANSCMVVATLIATFTFAAAFTAPGGFDQESGFPIFLRKRLFFLFIISDALSLFSSSTSVLMFLSIYTSRYEEEDFLKSLPKRLIIGLSTLFFSIATMMVAFCATMFLILSEHHNWISIPITFLAGVPVTLFVLLQFPLFLDMVCSTYGPHLLTSPSK